MCHCVWILLAHTHQKYQPLIPVIARPIYDTLGGRYIKCRRLWKTSKSITLARWINNHIFWVLHLGMEYAFLNIVVGILLPKCVGLWHTSNVYFFSICVFMPKHCYWNGICHKSYLHSFICWQKSILEMYRLLMRPWPSSPFLKLIWFSKPYCPAVVNWTTIGGTFFLWMGKWTYSAFQLEPIFRPFMIRFIGILS